MMHKEMCFVIMITQYRSKFYHLMCCAKHGCSAFSRNTDSVEMVVQQNTTPFMAVDEKPSKGIFLLGRLYCSNL